RREVRRHVHARLLPRPGTLRLPRLRRRLRTRRRARTARASGRRALRRRRARLLARRPRDPRTPPGRHGGDRRQQRHLGDGEAPDEGDVRLRRGGRPAGGHSLRHGHGSARRSRRAGGPAVRAGAGTRPRLRDPRAVAPQRAHQPVRLLPADQQPRVTSSVSARSVLRDPSYAVYFGTSFVSNVGTFMQNVGVPFAMFQLTHRNTWVGASVIAVMAPAVLVGPIAGTLADRVSRKAILACSNAIQAASALALWILAVEGELTPWRIIGLLV